MTDQPSAATLADEAATIALWQLEHERSIAESQPGSYAQHVSAQMLTVLANLRAARHAQQAAEALATEARAVCEAWAQGNIEGMVELSLAVRAYCEAAEQDASSADTP